MKFCLEIECDNEAFRNPSEEVQRIMRVVSVGLTGGRGLPGDPIPILDLNGNTVGEAGFKDMSHNPQLPLLVEVSEEQAEAIRQVIGQRISAIAGTGLSLLPDEAVLAAWARKELQAVFPSEEEGPACDQPNSVRS